MQMDTTFQPSSFSQSALTANITSAIDGVGTISVTKNSASAKPGLGCIADLVCLFANRNQDLLDRRVAQDAGPIWIDPTVSLGC
jgi:hypothetical protein